MEVSFEIRVALPTGKQREIIGRIIGDLERFVSRNPQYRPNDVAVVMTTGLLQQISPVGCNLSHEARIMDHRVRIMDGDGLEWYITAIHGCMSLCLLSLLALSRENLKTYKKFELYGEQVELSAFGDMF